MGIHRRSREEIYTIGHGNKSLEELVLLLKTYGVKILADVRSYPRSKRNPHFDHDNLAATLPKWHIRYEWFQELGGFRKKGLGAQSPHVAMQSNGFQHYADHMFTEAFREHVRRLSKLSQIGRTCVMCAETIPAKCHRWYLSDHLFANNVNVMHIIDMKENSWHKLSQNARVQEGHVIYDRLFPEQRSLFPE